MSQLSTKTNPLNQTNFFRQDLKRIIKYPLFFLGVILLFASSTFAQSNVYTFSGTDAFLDGWQGASIEITTITDGTISFALGINGPTSGAGPESVNFTVLPGETAMFCEVGGDFFPHEVGYTITNPGGVIILEVVGTQFSIGSPNEYQGNNNCFSIIGAVINGCPAGTEADSTSNCQPCAAGTFNPTNNSTCAPCVLGNSCLTCDPVTGDCLSCPPGFEVDPNNPTSCRIVCSIDSVVVTNVSCSDSGTPCDTSDDALTFDYQVFASVTGTFNFSFPALGATSTSLAYDTVHTFIGPLGSVGQGGVLVYIIGDSADPFCSFSGFVTDPGVCSVDIVDTEGPVCMTRDTTIVVPSNGSATVLPADLDNGSFDMCGTISSMTSSQTIFDCSDLGTNTVTLTVTDDLGNTSTCTTIVTVELDIISQPGFYFDTLTCAEVICPPGTSCPGNTDAPIPCLDGTFSDMEGAIVCTSCALNNGCLTCDQVNGDCLSCPPGFEVDPNDPTSCLAVCPIDTVIISNVSCVDPGTPCDPNDDFFRFRIEIQSSAPGTALVLLGSSGSISVPYNATLPTFSFQNLLVGNGDVTLTIIDNSDPTCTTTAIVADPGSCSVDNESPVCITNDIAVTLDENGNASITATDIDDGSTDNCTDLSSLAFSLSQTDFTCADLGTNTVTLTVTDMAGNSTTCQADVTVSSSTPVITCPADVSVGSLSEDTGVATSTSGTVTFSDVSTSDMVTRTWIATGICSADTCVQIITIVTNTPPTINCPADLVLTYGGLNAQDAAIQAWLDSATGTDNGVSVTVNNDYDAILFSDCQGFGTQTVTFSTAAGETCTAMVTVDFAAPNCATEGFESLNTGDIVSNQLIGVTVTAVSNSNPNAGNRAMIFDSANPTGGDSDLASAVEGNILIISEDGDSSDPDDDAQGGIITFDFDTPQYIAEMGFLDIENWGSYIRLYDVNGNLLQQLDLPNTGNGGNADLIVNQEDVSKVEVNLMTSGAVTSFCSYDQDLIPVCEDIACMTRPDCSAEDFEGFAAGDIVSNQISGTAVTGAANSNPGTNAAMIFDSENPTGGDYDLSTANDGFVIILSEDGDSSDPDDDAQGGVLTFTFDTPQFVDQITFLDIEGNNSKVRLLTAGGALIDEINIPSIGDGNQGVVDINTDDVAVMEVHFHTSGAIIDYCTYETGSLVECPPVTCDVQVLFSDFEGNVNGGYGVWTDGGSDATHHNFGSPRVVGTSGVRLRDNTNTSNITSAQYDLSSYDNLTVDFTYYAQGVESGEDFFFEISTDGGSSYTIVETWVKGTDFSNNTRYYENFDIPGPFSDEVKFRFRADFSVNNDRVYLDDILIDGCTTDGPPPALRVGNAEAQDLAEELLDAEDEILEELVLFPVPVSTRLTVNGLSGTAYQIYNLQGVLVKEGIYTEPIEMSSFETGAYILRAIDGRAARFVKF